MTAEIIEFKPRVKEIEAPKEPDPVVKYSMQMMYDATGQVVGGYVEEGIDPDEAHQFPNDLEELARLFRLDLEEAMGDSDEDVLYSVHIRRGGQASFWVHPDVICPEGMAYISEYLATIKSDFDALTLEEIKEEDGS